MNELISYIESLDPDFVRIQIAEGYDWQNSQRISSKQLRTGDFVLPELGKTKEIAVEFFFQFAKDHEFFIGFKLSPTQPILIEPAKFVETMILLATETSSPMRLIRAAGEKLLGDPEAYLNRTVDRAVGLVVNFWDEVGTIKVWQAGQKPLTRKSLEKKLSKNKQLLSNRKSPIVIEIDYGSPALWIGVDVSDKVNNNYVLQSEIVLAILRIAQHGS